MIPGFQVRIHMRLHMSGCRTLNPAHNMSIKVGFQSHDMRMMGGRIVRVHSTEQFVGIIKDGYSLMKNNK